MTREQVHMPHDTGYKFLLSSKKAFLQLLRSFVQGGWAGQVDETGLIRVDKSFILQDFQNKEADLVYRAKLKDKEVIFYVLMELQSAVDFLIPYRLLLYMTEIWRDIFKNTPRQKARRKDFRLPVIVPVVLYNGPVKWTAPLSFKETLESHELFPAQALDFRYILINVFSYSGEELLALSNLLGAVFYLDQAENLQEIIERLKKLAVTLKKMEPEDYRLFVAWAENILSRGLPPDEKNEITGILKQARPKEVEEMISNVERVLQKSLEDAMEKGVEKGIEKGIEKIARQMLAAGEDMEKIMKYTGLSREEIEKLT